MQQRGCCALDVLEAAKKLSAKIKSLLAVLLQLLRSDPICTALVKFLLTKLVCFDADTELESF